jgi:hypothetical protein
MRKNNTRLALSLLIAAGGCVAGAYSAYAASSNGKLITDGIPGTMFGLAFAAVVVISWLMLPWAGRRALEGCHRDAWHWRASWLMALGFVLANSVVYTVHYRTEMTEAKGLQIEAHERARHERSIRFAPAGESLQRRLAADGFIPRAGPRRGTASWRRRPVQLSERPLSAAGRNER